MSLGPWSRLAGAWHATYSLRGDPSFEGDSVSEASVATLLDGRFIRIDYTWSDRGKRQAGALLIGFEGTAALATTVWIDTWHNGTRMLISTGTMDDHGAIDVRGAYPTGAGLPDWGWRTQLQPSTDTWTMEMFNVSPDRDETLAVHATYVR
jgi:hypothetical protein